MAVAEKKGRTVTTLKSYNVKKEWTMIGYRFNDVTLLTF